ncbi:uncharacterized protein DS421_5g140830 [Arachis hypogaea]|nr:uncharacterized protein DS421_5g140830 [Arachis hypogaea]
MPLKVSVFFIFFSPLPILSLSLNRFQKSPFLESVHRKVQKLAIVGRSTLLRRYLGV